MMKILLADVAILVSVEMLEVMDCDGFVLFTHEGL